MKRAMILSVVLALLMTVCVGCSGVSAEEYDALQTEYDALQTEYEALQTEYATLKDEHDTLQTEHDTLQADYNTLSELSESIYEQNNKLNDQLEAACNRGEVDIVEFLAYRTIYLAFLRPEDFDWEASINTSVDEYGLTAYEEATLVSYIETLVTLAGASVGADVTD